MIIHLEQIDNNSKVWVYQASKPLTGDQEAAIKQDLYQFLDSWTSHQADLYTHGDIYHQLFLVIFVDERFAGTSGCSIDKSVHFIQDIEKKYGISLLDRTNVAYLKNEAVMQSQEKENIKIVPLHLLREAKTLGEIGDETLVFDNLVKTKGEFLTRWLTPVKDSWHSRFV